MEEEDVDFSVSTAARSRLSSLFQADNQSGDVNQALTFTAPKQPRKNENTQSSAETFKLLTAAVVHAYKLKDGSYANQGKLGCAILGLHETSSYKFLLYKGKQIQVTACSILPSFKFQVQPNNYVNIFDEKNDNWSINFESETALIEFAKQVALAKANSEGKNPSSLVVQDLVLGEGSSVDIGDATEIRYSCWSLSNYSFGKLLDSNMKSESALRLRLGKTKIIKGLSDGLVGAKKCTRRLLIIPPNLITEGATPSVPSNTTVIFETTVVKVKVSRESSHSPSPIKVPETVTEKKPELFPRPSISQEDNIRSRGVSISEQLSQSPKKDKAQIISRMAKMGTATLPFQGAVAAHLSSESENEEENPTEETAVYQNSLRSELSRSLTNSVSRKNSDFSLPSQHVHMQSVQPQYIPESVAMQVSQQSSQMALSSQVALPTQQAFVAPSPTMSFSTYQTAFPVQFPIHNLPGMMPTSIADNHLPMLMAETSSQNTEVRLSLLKITDKIDTVVQKVDELRLQRVQMPSAIQVPFMDSAVLVQNIERIVQENKQLKKDVEAKNSQILSLNDKICDIYQRNQRFFEESNNMMEQRSESMQAVSVQSQAKLLSLETENAKLSSDLLNATSKIAVMEEELNSNLEKESLVMSLQQKLKNAEGEKDVLAKKLKDSEAQCEQGQDTDDDRMEVLREKNKKLLRVKEEFESSTQDLQKKLKISEDTAKNLENRFHELHLEFENSLAWKKKYETFFERTQAMKEKYERQISELTSDIKQLKASGSGPVSANFSGEIKKVMNALFKILQGKFELNSSYEGSKVLELTLQSIRVLTFQMLEIKKKNSEKETDLDKVVNSRRKSFEAETRSQASSLESSEDSLYSNNKISHSPPVSEGMKSLDDGNASANVNCSNPMKLDANILHRRPSEQSEYEQNSMKNNPDDSKLDETSSSPKPESMKIPSNETEEVNSASPDKGQPLSSTNELALVLSDSGPSKV